MKYLILFLLIPVLAFGQSNVRSYQTDAASSEHAEVAETVNTDPEDQDFVIAFWFKKHGSDANNRLFTKYQNSTNFWEIFWTSGGQMRVQVRLAGNNEVIWGGTEASIVDGNWHYIVISIDRSDSASCGIYYDGVKETSLDFGTVSTTDCDYNAVANFSERSGIYYSAKVDEFQFYKGVVWDQAKVTSMYGGGTSPVYPGDESGLTFFNRFENSTIDYSDNGVDFTNTNGSFESDVPFSSYASNSNTNNFKVYTGTYIGTGLDDYPIEGIGFEPKFVMIKSDTADYYASYRFSSQTGDLSFTGTNTNPVANIIQSIDSDGFTIGTDTTVNSADYNYNFYCFGGDAGYIETGTYTGNGTDDRSISLSTSFNIGFMVVKGNSPHHLYYRLQSMTADSCGGFTTSGTTNRIQDFPSGNFQIGNNFNINTTDTTYNYLAIVNDNNLFVQTSYFGDGSDDRDLTFTPSTFIPEIFFIDEFGTSSDNFWDNAPSSEDWSHSLGNRSSRANTLQSIGTGTFQVGASSLANASGVKYYGWGFKNYTASTAQKRFKMYPKYPQFPSN